MVKEYLITVWRVITSHRWLRRLISMLLVVSWYGLIYWFSNQAKLPGFDHSWLNFIWFKTAHILVYAVLAGLVVLAWSQWLPALNWKQVTFLSVVVVFLFAVHDEWHQSFVSGRTSSWRDVVIDMLGAIGGLRWYYLLTTRQHRRRLL